MNSERLPFEHGIVASVESHGGALAGEEVAAFGAAGREHRPRQPFDARDRHEHRARVVRSVTSNSGRHCISNAGALRSTAASAVVGSSVTSSTPIADSPPNRPGVSARPFASTVVASDGALRPVPIGSDLAVANQHVGVRQHALLGDRVHGGAADQIRSVRSRAVAHAQQHAIAMSFLMAALPRPAGQAGNQTSAAAADWRGRTPARRR